uniref:3-oxo-5-alpha-steroid 4-dehydrogenase C-terminal domain-containing protein n=1 Tax=Arcella intermedia TaxID=1963864 RepID=A0A6B2LIB6_9EUKA
MVLYWSGFWSGICWNVEGLWYLGLMMIQVTRRCYECFMVQKIGNHKSLFLKAPLAWVFYFWASLAPILESIQTCSISTRIDYFSILHMSWISLLGSSLFLFGNYIQYLHHAYMANNSGTKKKYKVFNELWFRYVSNPHYFAEILIYLGLVGVTGGTHVSSWLILLFVITNLGLNGWRTHEWYKSHFNNYPPRKILIPFLF